MHQYLEGAVLSQFLSEIADKKAFFEKSLKGKDTF